ncbi:MAG TPA: peptide chain release factor 2 [Vicinamibacterales bacterium]|nr:peptide chain release factor 2 [Vicinamibacterales bacterium]
MRPISGAIFEVSRPDEELTRLDARAAAPDFWKDPADAQKVQQRRRRVEQDRDLMVSLKKKSDDLLVLLEWADAGESVGAEFAQALDALAAEIQAGEIKQMLGGPHDRTNAIVTIHPGAGGTESQDWAEMLLRMYLRWTERRGFKRELIDYQPGEDAGLKSVTFTVTGEYAYGLLSAEAGVHRLVRISPFDQAARRHTSFASVYVWPELPEDVDIQVEDKDLRIDTYRSSGAGGQHVNVTDSAVRITHLPTGMVVSCQNERSQHRNKDSAMQVLKARLYDLKMKENQAKLEQISGAKQQIAFGSQIRSYVLQPYQMVKDLRTREQTGDVKRVLDGDIDDFIKSYLMQRASGTLGEPIADEDD